MATVGRASGLGQTPKRQAAASSDQLRRPRGAPRDPLRSASAEYGYPVPSVRGARTGVRIHAPPTALTPVADRRAPLSDRHTPANLFETHIFHCTLLCPGSLLRAHWYITLSRISSPDTRVASNQRARAPESPCTGEPVHRRARAPERPRALCDGSLYRTRAPERPRAPVHRAPVH